MTGMILVLLCAELPAFDAGQRLPQDLPLQVTVRQPSGYRRGSFICANRLGV